MAATQQAVAKRRQVALDAIADAAIADDDAAVQARRAAEQVAAAEQARDKEALQHAKAAADAWIEATAEVEAGTDRLVAGLRLLAEAGAELVKFPGAAARASRGAALVRVGDYLSRRLFDAVRADNLGRVQLRAGGNARTRSFAASEREILDRLLAPPEQEDAEYTNGEHHERN